LWGTVHRDPKWESFRDILTSQPKLKKNKLIIFTESQETAKYLADQIAKEVEPKVICFSGQSDEAAHRAVISNC
jgi:ERCC4-related helicase